jgi:hypothetical protein
MMSADTYAVYLNFEGRIGLWDGDTPPTSYSDFVNFEVITVKPQEQDTVNLISRMTSNYGAVLASVNTASETAASVEIEASTFTDDMLALMLGSTYQTVSQTATVVVDEPVDLSLGTYIKLAHRYIESVSVTNAATATVLPSSALVIDNTNGMVKLMDISYSGAALVSYSVTEQSWTEFASGTAASEYVHITGETTNKVDRKKGTLDIWKASLKSSGTFNPVGGEFLKGSLSGDLITPSVAIYGAVPSRPWVWRRST